MPLNGGGISRADRSLLAVRVSVINRQHSASSKTVLELAKNLVMALSPM